MEIEVVAINIEAIEYGECFKWEGGYWIKSNLSREDNYECVDLSKRTYIWSSPMRFRYDITR